MKKTIGDLIKEKLKEIGADGLYFSAGDPCGCGISDLGPCGYNITECVAAKLKKNKYYPMEFEVSEEEM